MPFSSFTATFIEDFFPSLIAALRWLFPTYLSNPTCILAEAQVSLWKSSLRFGSFAVRNPTLLPIQLFGMTTGFFGYTTTKDLDNVKNHRLVSFAFLYFCLMNLTSIICHNIATRNSNVWAWASVLDIAFTGASALCLVASSFSSLDPNFFPKIPPNNHNNNNSSNNNNNNNNINGSNTSNNTVRISSSNSSLKAILPEILFIVSLIVASLGRIAQLPWAPEAVYLGSMVVATLTLGPRLHLVFPKGSLADYLIIVVGVLMLHFSCICDRVLFCKLMDQDKVAYFTGVHLIFLGSNITFLGLHRYVMSSSTANDSRVLKKSHGD